MERDINPYQFIWQAPTQMHARASVLNFSMFLYIFLVVLVFFSLIISSIFSTHSVRSVFFVCTFICMFHIQHGHDDVLVHISDVRKSSRVFFPVFVPFFSILSVFSCCSGTDVCFLFFFYFSFSLSLACPDDFCSPFLSELMQSVQAVFSKHFVHIFWLFCSKVISVGCSSSLFAFFLALVSLAKAFDRILFVRTQTIARF